MVNVPQPKYGFGVETTWNHNVQAPNLNQCSKAEEVLQWSGLDNRNSFCTQLQMQIKPMPWLSGRWTQHPIGQQWEHHKIVYRKLDFCLAVAQLAVCHSTLKKLQIHLGPLLNRLSSTLLKPNPLELFSRNSTAHCTCPVGFSGSDWAQGKADREWISECVFTYPGEAISRETDNVVGCYDLQVRNRILVIKHLGPAGRLVWPNDSICECGLDIPRLPM